MEERSPSEDQSPKERVLATIATAVHDGLERHGAERLSRTQAKSKCWSDEIAGQARICSAQFLSDLWTMPRTKSLPTRS